MRIDHVVTPGQTELVAPKLAERRRHQRVKVALLGRYMLADRREFPCQTIDMSPGGVALFAPVSGEIGSRVVAYIEYIGRIEGHIVRHLEHGFALSLNAPLIKRDKLADQLTWLANRTILDIPEDRRHERIIPRNARSTLRLEDGGDHIVRVIDVSLSGAAVEIDVKPPLGTLVTLGKTPGRIARHFQGGVAIEFIGRMPEETFDSEVEL